MKTIHHLSIISELKAEMPVIICVKLLTFFPWGVVLLVLLNSSMKHFLYVCNFFVWRFFKCWISECKWCSTFISWMPSCYFHILLLHIVTCIILLIVYIPKAQVRKSVALKQNKTTLLTVGNICINHTKEMSVEKENIFWTKELSFPFNGYSFLFVHHPTWVCYWYEHQRNACLCLCELKIQ